MPAGIPDSDGPNLAGAEELAFTDAAFNARYDGERPLVSGGRASGPANAPRPQPSRQPGRAPQPQYLHARPRPPLVGTPMSRFVDPIGGIPISCRFRR
jgi:hypothetical protein